MIDKPQVIISEQKEEENNIISLNDETKQTELTNNNENEIDIYGDQIKRLKSNSIISSGSGSVNYEKDEDSVAILPTLNPQQDIKKLEDDDFYISSEDESSNLTLDIEKHKCLNRDLKEESKFGKLELKDKEKLYSKKAILFKNQV